MKRDSVIWMTEVRSEVIEAMIYAWVDVHGVEVLSASVSGMHMHVLARFGRVPNPKPTPSRRGLGKKDPARFLVGIAKERSSKALIAAGLAQPGGVWAKRGKIVPIKDRRHQVKVFRYILDHESEGAAVWCFKDAE